MAPTVDNLLECTLTGAAQARLADTTSCIHLMLGSCSAHCKSTRVLYRCPTACSSLLISTRVAPSEMPNSSSIAYLEPVQNSIIAAISLASECRHPLSRSYRPAQHSRCMLMPLCIVQAIGFTGSMLITHRLDRCTEGLTVIGKTPEFVRRFNNLIQGHKGAVHKFYRTLTAKPPPLGSPRLCWPLV